MTLIRNDKEFWAIVPICCESRAKSRLAGYLGHSTRISLYRAMIADVLHLVTGHPAIDRTLVVTSDDRAAALARGADASVIPDPVCPDTNTAVQAGIGALSSANASGCIVVPVDLPFLTRGELSAVIAGLGSSPVVLAPAQSDGGTNLLAMAPAGRIPTAFGPDSYLRHLDICAAAGIRPVVLDLPGAGRDLDTPSDLYAPRPGQGGHATRQMLDRLQPANASTAGVTQLGYSLS